jgi:hypothetical protein
MVGGEGESMGTSSTSAHHMHGVESEMIEEPYCILGNDGDASTRKTTGRTVTGPVEGDYADAEVVVLLLVRVTRVTRPRRALEAKERLTVPRPVLAPGERAAVS